MTRHAATVATDDRAPSRGRDALARGATDDRKSATDLSLKNQHVATDGKRSATDLATDGEGLATDGKAFSIGGDEIEAPMISANEAVSLFFIEMIDLASGGDLKFRRVADNYRDRANKHGWPEVSDRKLSQLLSGEHGCIVRSTNKRDADGKRLSIVIFPKLDRVTLQ